MQIHGIPTVQEPERSAGVRDDPSASFSSKPADSAACHRYCQLCGRGPLERFEIPGSSTMWLCRECELYQYGHHAAATAYTSEYHAGYMRHRGHKVRTARLRLNRIAGLNWAASPSLLEIGCSVGCTLDAAAARGWKAIGADVSQDAVATCRKLGHMSFLVGPLELPFNDAMFDIVVAWHVIEHVHDVRKTLAEWHRVLKTNGLIALETPDATCPKVRRLGTAYRKFWAPEHTYTFTYRNLGQFLKDAGFEIVRSPWLGPWRQLPRKLIPYAAAYQSYHGLRYAAGIEKAFLIVGRKSPRKVSAAVA
ncbi:MAG: class I SAM-dependent methyltransferase [Pirellulales bacterium]|nr:class I SAM-dependent methyltransferase [Pirellulales bacterium]